MGGARFAGQGGSGELGEAWRNFEAMEGYGSDNILQQEAEARAVMGEEPELFTGQQDKEMWLCEPGVGPRVWLCLRAVESSPRAYIQAIEGILLWCGDSYQETQILQHASQLFLEPAWVQMRKAGM